MKSALIAAAIALFVPAAAFAQAGDSGASDSIHAHYTLGTPIKVLIADPAARAVLDKDLPGLSTDENLPQFEDKSLREFQPLTGGQLTDALLTKVAADLAAIGDDGDAGAKGDASTNANANIGSPGDDAATTSDAAPAGDADKPAPVGDPLAPIGR